jgi:hypothetical protein
MTRAIEKLHPQNALTVLEQEMDRFMDKFFGRHPVRAALSEVIAVQISGLTAGRSGGCRCQREAEPPDTLDWVPHKDQFNVRRLNLCTKYAAFFRRC